MKKKANASRMKSSPEARELIRAVKGGGRTGRRKRSLRDVARLLRIPNHGQVQKILNGEIRDTPAMKAALRRAEQRAKRAWLNVKAAPQEAIDEAAVRALVDEMERTLKFARSLLPKR